MEWSEIRRKHPDKFILIGDIVEKKYQTPSLKSLREKFWK